jgi:hypothetical protein
MKPLSPTTDASLIKTNVKHFISVDDLFDTILNPVMGDLQ